jgi:hypothetical protein
MNVEQRLFPTMDILMIQLIIELLFIMWFILSVIFQLKTTKVEYLRKYDFFSLIPRFDYFGLNPVDTKFDLKIQVLNKNKTCLYSGPFWVPQKRMIRRVLWNPEWTRDKAIFDLFSSFISSDGIYHRASPTTIHIIFVRSLKIDLAKQFSEADSFSFQLYISSSREKGKEILSLSNLDINHGS